MPRRFPQRPLSATEVSIYAVRGGSFPPIACSGARADLGKNDTSTKVQPGHSGNSFLLNGVAFFDGGAEQCLFGPQGF